MTRLCANCGAFADHAHHALPKGLYPEGRRARHNLVVLCVDCHMGWHDGNVVIYREVLPIQVQAWLGQHASEGWLDHWYPLRDGAAGIF